MRDVREEQEKKESVRTPFLMLLCLLFKAEFLRCGEGNAKQRVCHNTDVVSRFFPSQQPPVEIDPTCFTAGRQELLTSVPKSQ